MIHIENQQIQPHKPEERIEILDIVRGFALFGVLLVNMTMFNSTLFAIPTSPVKYTGLANQVAAWGIQILASGKFYTMFSFLFGLGFYIFMERCEAKGLAVVPLYRRRLFILLIFGILHLTFIWTGDILHTYALAGFILLALRKKEFKSIKRWMLGFLIFTSLLIAFAVWGQALGEMVMGEELLQHQNYLKIKSINVYGNGTYWDILHFRLTHELLVILSNLLYVIPNVLVLFLCGFYVGKKQIYKNVEENLPFIQKVRKTGGSIGILLTILYVVVDINLLAIPPIFKGIIVELAKQFSAILLCFFYISTLVLLLRRDAFRKKLKPLAYMGRMALTNYLMQSIFCVTVFYGFGMGYLGKLSVIHGIIFTLILFIVQIFFSKIWLKHFQYGPMEWLWRTCTYKRKQPMVQKIKG